ncbi:putative leucine-rich repeat domain superfamily [Helianthus anomalus]
MLLTYQNLLSVSALISLTIHGCDLPSSFMVDALKFKSLTRLKLENIHIDDEVITYLATSCPLLQVIQIRSCHGLKRFCVYGHHQHL